MAPTDDLVQKLSYDAKRHAKRADVPVIRCALIGAACSKIHIVPVPVDTGYTSDPRPIDLRYDLYLEANSSQTSFMKDLDGIMVEYDHHPGFVNSYGWTVFKSDHQLPKINKLVPSFYGADNLTAVARGSYLVVKSDRGGIARNITKDDFQLVRDVVVDSLAATQTEALEAVAASKSSTPAVN
ncbi:hypothetical protein EST38_g11790 [Candolleomyces aberdarensis]|uniref:Uncharacterized protein n=1 Tax=Candolleomyces aberdarensis TaxID=2316362 RepID=A0A4Q2D7B6_9AGAR|nr:hypothetical protein EST38_g11790 [Candolleomyces aberdarensis]